MILAGLLVVLSCGADDAEIARLLKEKGVKVTESKGAVTGLEIGDCSAWTEEDFRRVGQLTHLRTLSVGAGLADASLPLLSGLTELESLSTNLAKVTDAGVKGLAALRGLKVLKFFHPCKEFSGSGLASLAELPALERLTVAGSLAFNDDGMAGVAALKRLKEFRTWHAGQTLEGVKKLKELPNLQQLTLGQRLAYKPPTTVSDETIAVLVELKTLESLQLEEAQLSKDALARLQELPALKKLALEGIEIAGGDAEGVRAALPKVEVKWTAPNETYLKRIRALFGEMKN